MTPRRASDYRPRVTHIALIALLMLSAPPKAFREGEQLFAKGKYTEAAKRFEEAFAENPDHAYLFNAAVAYEKAGDTADALRVYEKFAVFTPNPERRAQVEAKVKTLEAELARTHTRLQVSVEPAGAFLFIDAEPKPLETPFEGWLPAGRHELSLRKSGFEALTEVVELTAGEPRKVRVTLRALGAGPTVDTGAKTPSPPPRADATPIQGPPVEPVAPTSSGGIATRWWFWTAIGVVVAGGVTATVLLWPDGSTSDSPSAGTWKVNGGQ